MRYNSKHMLKERWVELVRIERTGLNTCEQGKAMPRAIIQGEIHTSRQDKGLLREHASDADAIIRESMEQTFGERRDLLYLLLFTGMKLYRNVVQRVFYVSNDVIFEMAEEHGATVHRMDTDIAAWNDRTATWKKILLFGFAVTLTYSMIVDIPQRWLQAFLSPVLFVLSYFLYAAVFTIPERDELMADRIRELADEHGYETVIVSVGDAHIDGITADLEDAGWDVETHSSDSIIGRILRPFMNVLKKLPD